MKISNPEEELIKNVKRRGGPFDTVIVPPTKCETCGEVFEKKLRWHYKHNGVCPKCNGELDQTPLANLTVELIQKWKAAIDSVQV